MNRKSAFLCALVLCSLGFAVGQCPQGTVRTQTAYGSYCAPGTSHENAPGAQAGLSPVTKTEPPELAALRTIADSGDSEAQNEMGVRYAKGIGVQEDDSEAALWFSKAAEKGQAKAQFNLGIYYRNGYGGLKRDEIEAGRWFRAAALQGNAAAQYYLGSMYESGDGVQKNEAEALRWYRKASVQGYEQARSKLMEASVAAFNRKLGIHEGQSQAVVKLILQQNGI